MSGDNDSSFSWWRAAIVLTVMGMSFTGGTVISNHETRLDTIEVREVTQEALSAAKELRIRTLEIQQATIQGDISAIRSILTRMEHGLESDRMQE